MAKGKSQNKNKRRKKQKRRNQRRKLKIRKKLCYNKDIDCINNNKSIDDEINCDKSNEKNENNIEDDESEEENNIIINNIGCVNKKIKSGLVGLANIGATCYMNATLQCFSNIIRLRQALLDKKTYKILQKGKDANKVLSFAFAEVLKNLWNNCSKKYYSPEHFKNVISKMNPLFEGIAANDSKDLIIFMLENMHNELNLKKDVILNTNNDYIPDPRNFFLIYKEFKENYFKTNDSIILQEFYGFNNIQTKCGNCQTMIHNVQTFNILFFPLEEIRKFKNYAINTVSIVDCFDYNQKIDIYPSFYCNFCKNNSPAFSQTILIDAPKSLIINLNRGKGIQFNINIKFGEFLDLKNYVINKEKIYYYELVGVLSHYGPSNMGGHFISFCKNSEDGNWYKFNDSMVEESNFNEVSSSGMPYVLFYSYITI